MSVPHISHVKESFEVMAGILYVVKMDEGKVSKPLAEAQILALVKSGRLTAEQLVRRTDGKTWQPLHVVFGLSAATEQEHEEEQDEEPVSYMPPMITESPAAVEAPPRKAAQAQNAGTNNADVSLSQYPAILHFARVLQIVARIWRIVALLSLCVFGLIIIFCFVNRDLSFELIPSFAMILTSLFMHWACSFWSDVIRYLAALSVRWVQAVDQSTN